MLEWIIEYSLIIVIIVVIIIVIVMIVDIIIMIVIIIIKFPPSDWHKRSNEDGSDDSLHGGGEKSDRHRRPPHRTRGRHHRQGWFTREITVKVKKFRKRSKWAFQKLNNVKAQKRSYNLTSHHRPPHRTRGRRYCQCTHKIRWHVMKSLTRGRHHEIEIVEWQDLTTWYNIVDLRKELGAFIAV